MACEGIPRGFPISRHLVYDLLRAGQLRSRKAGNRRLIGLRQIEAFLAEDE